MKVLDLVTKLDEGYYEADPAVFFPAVLARIRACVAGEPPTEIVTAGWPGRADREPVADRTLREAEKMPAAAWELALQPYSGYAALLDELKIHPDPETEEKLKKTLELRAMALGFIESWFKRALSIAVGGPVRLHITKNLDWRR